MWVVKLGGSLAASDRLPDWLRALAGRSDLVLVPGGGPFADQVRAMQARWGFDDATAHHLALLAMEQFGRMLCALQVGLAPAATPSAMDAVMRQGETPVWMPTTMVLDDARIASSWDVTSDSLAAWLCGRIGASGLLLVKSVPLEGTAMDLGVLSERGIVDATFPEYARVLRVPVRVLSEADLDRLAGALGGQESREPPPSRGAAGHSLEAGRPRGENRSATVGDAEP
jgi:aspartokinase-like uncharacterized kinase